MIPVTGLDESHYHQIEAIRNPRNKRKRIFRQITVMNCAKTKIESLAKCFIPLFHRVPCVLDAEMTFIMRNFRTSSRNCSAADSLAVSHNQCHYVCLIIFFSLFCFIPQRFVIIIKSEGDDEVHVVVCREREMELFSV